MKPRAGALWSRPTRFACRAALVGSALSLACGGSSRSEIPLGEEPLETVRIEEPADAVFDPASDVREERDGPSFAGVLPADFPSDLPIYEPSALVDYGVDFVELSTSASASQILASLREKARAQGWTSTATDSGLSLSKSGRRASVVVRRAPSGESLVRIQH